MTEEIAKILLDTRAVTLSPRAPYKYASGILSPIYCDNRLLMSYPERRRVIIENFKRIIQENNIEFDVVAGTATAGIPWAAWLAAEYNKPMIYVRSTKKVYGKENTMEGKLNPGQKVLIIEDLVSTGKSSVGAVGAARTAGGIVSHCLAIFSYELEKSKNSFEEKNCKLISLCNFSTLVPIAVESNYINEEEKDTVLEWNKNPKEWGKQMGYE